MDSAINEGKTTITQANSTDQHRWLSDSGAPRKATRGTVPTRKFPKTELAETDLC